MKQTCTPAWFGSKAETLTRLKEACPELNVPALTYFSAAAWLDDPPPVLADIARTFPDGGNLAIRSSSRKEDGETASGAGAFDSVLNIPASDAEALSATIQQVIASYPGGFAEAARRGDQVLIQRMVADVSCSGVIMTRSLEDGSPYYTINYDDESGLTDTITGGSGVGKTVYVYRGVKGEDFDSERVKKMVTLARSLEERFGDIPLDIEFALTRAGVMHLLQVRPICCQNEWRTGVQKSVSSNILFVEQFISQCLAPKAGLFGERNILGVMPDWNPAELIGITPRPLAASLFREVVTRRVWSLARERMGYRTMPPEELMILVAGRPYIDVRASFNSFLPGSVSRSVGSRIVEACLERLDNYPELHDKVEFELMPTAMDFSLHIAFESRYPGLLKKDEQHEFMDALRRLTAANLDLSEKGSMGVAQSQIDELRKRQSSRPQRFDSEEPGALLVQVKSLAEECCNLGSLPFSILARHGFIAEALLRSAATREALAAERVAEFKRSVYTISHGFSRDFRAACQNAASRDDFLRDYGHLRPGTYDILSPRYTDRPELFNGARPAASATPQPFTPTGAERLALDALLEETGLAQALNSSDLFEYARRAIAAREYGKFVFSRNISDILEALAAWGAHYGLSREDLSYLTLEGLLAQTVSPILSDPLGHFTALRERGEELSNLSRSLKLSYLIRSSRDVYVVPQHRSAPNFITSKCIEAEVKGLSARSSGSRDLCGKIVCIESADPGYDWIFAKSIAGLVTKFGGANSHMAIRCAEYGIPAAIGCGEKLFESVSTAARVELNAGGKTLRPLAR